MQEDKLHKKLMEDYRSLLKTPMGRAVLYHITLLGPEADSIYCSEKAQDTAFNCGRAYVSESVKKLIREANKTVYEQMRNEWNSMVKSLEKEQSEEIYG